MNRIAFHSWVLVLLLAPLGLADEAPHDVRKGVPTDAYIAVYAQHNPERDFQLQYAKQAWQIVQDEKLIERIAAIVMDRLPGEHKEAATSISDELKEIFDPVDWQAVADSPEVVYGQVMELPQTQHLVLLRLPSDEVAMSCEMALKKLGEMIERRSEGAVDATLDDAGDTKLYTLTFPNVKEFPFQPAFTRADDVLVVSTSAKLARRSVDSLLSGGESKFDDPRLQAALDKLPTPEDALVFYDGQQQFRTLRGMGQFIREKSHEDAKAVRIAGLIERIIDEMAILDYEVAVETTDGQKNIKMKLGQLVPGAEHKLLYQICASGEPFENWQRWVPADAQAYSLSTGVNLHPLYAWVVQLIHDDIPEAQPALEQFEKKQQEWGVQLDSDLLQVFSGECVCVALPAASPATVGGQDKVLALRCHKSERIREILHQWVDRLEKIPYAQSQQLQLSPSKELEGFDELSMNLLAVLGVRPVVGFHDDWMIVASNAAAAQKVLRTLSGDSASIDTSEQFRRFGLELEGPVYAIRYTDLAASTRRAAQLIRQIGVFAPMIAGMAGAQADQEKMKLVQEVLALLPDVANVVERFDYLQARLSVVQKGPDAGTYMKRSITLVRPPGEKSNHKESAANAHLEGN